jgi:hypothetical protein
VAAEAITEYNRKAGLENGPLVRPRSGPKSVGLKNNHITETGMYLLLDNDLEILPRGYPDR